jgi:hypothetical protein
MHSFPLAIVTVVAARRCIAMVCCLVGGLLVIPCECKCWKSRDVATVHPLTEKRLFVHVTVCSFALVEPNPALTDQMLNVPHVSMAATIGLQSYG